ncbi:MAG: TlpA family protein disulfide reductase [Anaerolineae bacterium]|nr:TlpA family protein disulfide reductase [Anaerolineae bacterium]
MQLLTPKNIRLPGLIVLAASGLWIALSASLPGTSASLSLPAPQAGFIAPDFTLTSLDGDSYTLSELRGKPILVNLWASWCGPCRQEMPAMQALYEEFHPEGFEILAVNAANQDNIPAAAAFVEELGLSFPILLDLDGEVSRMYQLRALPSSFFINPDGSIAEVVIGGPMAEALLRTRIEKLIARLP